jgi:pimeloyl-ACP methyl ester carboxylesterase
MGETMVTANGRNFATVVDGYDDGVPLVLVNGLGSQLVSWPVEMVELLVSRGFRVLSFDNRDAGLTEPTPLTDANRAAFERSEPLEAQYLVSDMADDTAALIGVVFDEPAHVVGVSMGGMVVQQLAIDHPGVVASLTSVMSSPGRPASAPSVLEALIELGPSTAENAVEHAVQTYILTGGPEADPVAIRQRVETEVARAYNPEGQALQMAGVWHSPDRTDALGGLPMPALVVHGAVDPLVTPRCGHATAEAIGDATMLEIDDMGHWMEPVHFSQLVAAITSMVATT